MSTRSRSTSGTGTRASGRRIAYRSSFVTCGRSTRPRTSWRADRAQLERDEQAGHSDSAAR